MNTIITPPIKHKLKMTVTTPTCTQQIDVYFTVAPTRITSNETATSPTYNQTIITSFLSININPKTTNTLILPIDDVPNTNIHVPGTDMTEKSTPAIKKSKITTPHNQITNKTLPTVTSDNSPTTNVLVLNVIDETNTDDHAPGTSKY